MIKISDVTLMTIYMYKLGSKLVTSSQNQKHSKNEFNTCNKCNNDKKNRENSKRGKLNRERIHLLWRYKGYQTFFYPIQQTSYNLCRLKPILRYVRNKIEFSTINVISNTLTSPRKRRVSLFLRASPLIGPATHFYWRIIPEFVLPRQVF